MSGRNMMRNTPGLRSANSMYAFAEVSRVAVSPLASSPSCAADSRFASSSKPSVTSAARIASRLGK